MSQENRTPSIEATHVGQLVAGGSVRSTDRSIKITNTWVEVQRESPPDPPMLTALQRKQIAVKVGQAVEQTGLSRMDLYKVILTECGFERMDDMPRPYYGEIMSMLETMIRQAAPVAAPAPKPQPAFARRLTLSIAMSGAAMLASLAAANRPADEELGCKLGEPALHDRQHRHHDGKPCAGMRRHRCRPPMVRAGVIALTRDLQAAHSEFR